MDKSWNQLSDRCNLFYTAPDGLYKELLKEAEVELANKCSLYKASISYNFANIQTSTRIQNSVKLPNTYKSMISVWVNGDEIPRREKHQWTFNKDANGMTVQSGTPNYYDLANGFIFFDKAPSTSDVVDCYFKAHMPNTENLSKNVMLKPLVVASTGEDNYDSVLIDCTIGAELDGFGCSAGFLDSSAKTHTLSSLKFNKEDHSTFEPFDPGQFTYPRGNSLATDPHPENHPYYTYQKFDGGDGSGADFIESHSGGSSTATTSDNFYRKGSIGSYRKVGPVIENDYHLNLCDYAIYMASAKGDPELSMKHLQIWEQRLTEILNDNIDKELPFGMKEEI